MNENKKNDDRLHSGHRQRLKNRALEEGLDSFSAHEVLELLLFYSMPYKDTNELAHHLVNRFGNFWGVLNADYQDLLRVDGIGPNTASLLALMPEFFRRYQMDSYEERVCLSDVHQIGEYVVNLFIGQKNETFYMICLDILGRLNRAALIAQGTLSEVSLYPRAIMETALRYQSKNVILAHNHPGGNMRPSSDDIQLTAHIVSVLNGVGIKVLDHIIVHGKEYYSFVEKGVMPDLLKI